MAAGNLFSRAKQYTKDHPRTSYQDAIKKLSGKKVSGVKKAAPAKKRKVHSVTGNTKVSGTKTKREGVNDLVMKAKKIIARIETMERDRAKEKDKDLRDVYSIAINAEHKKLRNLKTAHK